MNTVELCGGASIRRVAMTMVVGSSLAWVGLSPRAEAWGPWSRPESEAVPEQAAAGYEDAAETARLNRPRDEEIERLRSDYAGLVAEKKAIEELGKRESALLQKDLDAYRKAVLGYDQGIEELTARVVRVEDALKREQRGRREEQERSARLQGELESAREEIVQTDRQLAAAGEAEDKIRVALRGSELAVAEVTSRLSSEEKRAAGAEKRCQELLRRSASLESGLAAERREREKLQALVRDQQGEMKRLEAAVADAAREKRSAISDARSSLDLLEDLLSKHQDLLGDLESSGRGSPGPAS